jgi:fatty-acyl-CoA synthase
VPDEKWGEVGVAFVVPLPGTTPSPDALTAHLGERLARYKVPREYRFLAALPRTAYGKVVKAELRDLLLAGRDGR